MAKGLVTKNDFLKKEAQSYRTGAVPKNTSSGLVTKDDFLRRETQIIGSGGISQQSIFDTETDFKKWSDSVGKFQTRVSKEYSSRGDGYQDKSEVGRDTASLTSEATYLKSQADRYRNYFKNNKDRYGEEQVNEILKGLDETTKYLDSVRDTADADHDYWSQWGTEADYNEHVRLSNLNLRATEKNVALWNTELKMAEKKISAAHEKVNSYSNLNMTKEMQDAQAELEAAYAEQKRLKKQISDAKKDVNNAGKMQTLSKYYALMNEANFEEYAAKGAAIKNPTFEEASKAVGLWNTKKTAKKAEETVGNIVTFSRDNYDALLAAEADGAAAPGDRFYAEMTDDQVKIYNSLLGRGDKAGAQEFLDLIREGLQTSAGVKLGNKINDMNPVAKAAVLPMFSLGSGVDQAVSGMSQVLSGEQRVPASETQAASQTISESLGAVGKTLYGAGTTVGNMLPSIAVSMLAGPAAGKFVGAATMGVSATGNAINQALQEGYSYEQARSYGLMVGASETVLQTVLGGISKLGGLTTEKALLKIAGIENAIVRLIGSGVVKLGSEIAEEELQLLLEPKFAELILHKDYEAPTWQEAVETAIITALSTGLLEGGEIVGTEINYAKLGETVMSSERVNVNAVLGEALTNFKDGSAVKKLAQKIETQKESGQSLNASDVGRLYTMVYGEIGAGTTVRETTTKTKTEKSETKKAPFATKAETDRLLKQTKSEDAETSAYATAQLAHEEETVVSPIAQTLMDKGMKPADAVEQAALIMKVQSGQKLSNSEEKKLNFANESVRAAFAEATGVEVTPAHAQNGAPKRKVIRSASEVKAAMEKFAEAEKAQETARATAQAETEAAQQVEQEQARAVNRARAENMASVMLEEAIAREEQTIEYADGSTQTQSEFVEAYMSQFPSVSEEEAVNTFNDYKRLNSMGQKVPEPSRPVKGANTSDKRSSVSEPENGTSELKRTEAGRAKERELTLKELNRIGGKYGVTVEMQDPDGTSLHEKEDGYYDPKAKKLVLNSKKCTNQFLMTKYFVHELTHHGQSADGNVSTGLTAEIIKSMRSPAMEKMMKQYFGTADVDKIVAATRARYEAHFKKTGKDLSVLNEPNYIEDEVAANFMMKAIGNRSLLDTLAGVTVKPHRALIRNVKSFLSGKKDADIGVKEAKRLIERMQTSLETAAKNKNTATERGEKRLSLVGTNQDGIEVYETSPEIMGLTWDERKARYLDVMKNEYFGRTAKFERNGHVYYATFDQGSIRKPIYGDNRSSAAGVKALIKAGADGDVFDLVENSKYTGSKPNTKSHTKADYFDYFVKTVQIDGKVFDLMADVEKKYGADGGYVYTLALVDNKNIKASPAHGTPKTGPVKSAGNASGVNVAQNGQTVNPQKRLSIDDGEYAPTYYSQMERVVQGMKQAKFGASSVVSMLRGRGVKAEEIKWSGVEQWLEGKKSVTKDELLEFIAGSELQIEEEELGNPKYTQGELETLHLVEKDLEELTTKAADKWQILFGTEIPAAAFDGETLYGSIKRAIENAPTHPDISEIMEDADRMEERKRALREMNQILSSIREVESIRDDAVALAEERSAPKWDQYKLDGGSNYRELQFYLPDSNYTNLAMQAHWGADAEGVLAHARMQDFDTENGKMLFIEEIQSDWHNAGHKEGYADKNYDERKALADLDRRRDELRQKIHKDPTLVSIRDRLVPGILETNKSFGQDITEDTAREYAGNLIMTSFYPAEVEHKGNITLSLAEKQAIDDLHEEMRQLTLERIDARTKAEEMKRRAPEAPFSNNYHEYVLKRLLRMAAEEGYGSIGWTTAQQQVDRWSEDYAEGYRIEYDQDIPKFLNKYGKQWGAKVGQTALPGGGDQSALSRDLENLDPYDEYDIRQMVHIYLEDADPDFGERNTDTDVKQAEDGLSVTVRDIDTWEEWTMTSSALDRVKRSGGEQTVWSMPITDAMRQSVLYEGQPRYSISSEMDDAYMQDVENGDDIGAQLLVERAAHHAGYDVEAYHGTDSDFWTFSLGRRGRNGEMLGVGYYFAANKDDAEMYASRGGKVISAFLDIKKPISTKELTITPEEWGKFLDYAEANKDQYIAGPWKGNRLNKDYELRWMGDFENDAELIKTFIDTTAGRNAEVAEGFLKMLKDSTGYDGVDYRNGNAHVYVAFTPEQIKSADTVVRDDAGEVIPLSERFNPSSPDVRYSIDPVTDYEEGSVEDKVLKLLRAGTTEDAISMLEQWVADIEAGNIDPDTVESSLKDAYFKAQPLTPQQRADNRKKLDDLVKKYGAIKPGEKAARQVIIPKQVDDRLAVSKFARTVAEAKQTPEWYKEQVERNVVDKMAGFTYEMATDKAAMAYLEKLQKERRLSDLQDEWETIVKTGSGSGKFHMISKNDIILGEYLYTVAVNGGDVDLATKYASELASIGTAAGQVVQAMSLLKKLTPSGKLNYLYRTIERLNRSYKDKIDSGKMDKIKIDQDLAAAVLDAKSAEDAQAAMDALLQDVANQVPTTFMEKWNAWRYLAMLGNPTTHIRNIASNVAFSPVVFAKDIAGAVLELALKPEQRTKHWGQAFSSFLYSLPAEDLKVFGKNIQLSKLRPKIGKYVKFADVDYQTMQDVLQGNSKRNPSDLIRDKRPVFRSKPGQAVNWLSDKNSSAMEKEDIAFLRGHYVRALSQYLAAQKADVASLTSTPEGCNLLAKARKWAVREAQKATFRDASALAAALSKLERTGGVAGQIIVGGVMPFKKTPVNILKRGVEYSPVGVLKLLKQLTKNKDSAAGALDTIAASLTGAGIAYLGFYLAKEGLLRASGGDDEKERELEELQGAQEYSLLLDDGSSYTINWMAPAALPLFVGAEYADIKLQGKELTFGDFVNEMIGLAEPMFQLSLIDSLNQTLSAVKYSEDGMETPAVVGAVLSSYFGSAIPTVVKKIGRSVDGTRRTVYVDKNSEVPEEVQRMLQNMTKDLRGDESAAYIDAWGRTDTQANKWLGVVENFLSPGYASVMNTSSMEEELLRVYKETGDAGVLPSSVSKYFTVGDTRHDLTQDEWETYQVNAGQGSYEMMTSLVNSQAYQGLNDKQKVDAINRVFTYCDEHARKLAVPEYEMGDSTQKAWVLKADQLTEKGVSVEDYIVHAILTGGEPDTTHDTQDILSMDWLDDDGKAALISAGYGKKLEGNTFSDPFRTGYQYTLTDAQALQYTEYYDEQWSVEYQKLISGNRFKRATLEEQTEMVNDLSADVADDTKKWMARNLRQSGIRSTKKD